MIMGFFAAPKANCPKCNRSFEAREEDVTYCPKCGDSNWSHYSHCIWHPDMIRKAKAAATKAGKKFKEPKIEMKHGNIYHCPFCQVTFHE